MQLPLSRATVLEMSGQLATDLLDCKLSEPPREVPEQSAGASVAYAIDLRGKPSDFAVAIQCRLIDARKLAARMTGKSVEGLPDKVVEDALAEWLNISAGQIKSLGGLDHALGLPRQLVARQEELDGADRISVYFGEIGVQMLIGLINAQLSSEF